MEGNGFAELLRARRTVREFSDRPVPLGSVRRLLWAAQGVTAEDGRRTAPSAHALHPLRLFFAAGRVEGLDAGVYSVERRDTADLALQESGDVRVRLEAAALEDQPWIAESAGIITVCADLVTPVRDFADQPPYGQRGLRYVQIEAGAVAQNVHLQATADGIACVLVAGFRDEETARVLKLEPPVAPVLHMCLGYAR